MRGGMKSKLSLVTAVTVAMASPAAWADEYIYNLSDNSGNTLNLDVITSGTVDNSTATQANNQTSNPFTGTSLVVSSVTGNFNTATITGLLQLSEFPNSAAYSPFSDTPVLIPAANFADSVPLDPTPIFAFSLSDGTSDVVYEHEGTIQLDSFTADEINGQQNPSDVYFFSNTSVTTAVPEPISMSLLGGGLAMLGAARRGLRRRRG